MSFDSEMKRLIEDEVKNRSAETIYKVKQSRKSVEDKLEIAQREVADLKRRLTGAFARCKHLKDRLRISDQNLTRANEKLKKRETVAED